MTYSGSTALSSVANPPIQIARGIGGVSAQSTATGGGRGLWFYGSSNGSTEIQAANFFTDAYYLGMKAGDMILGVSNTGSTQFCWVAAVGAVTTNGTSISTGSVMTSTFA